MSIHKLEYLEKVKSSPTMRKPRPVQRKMRPPTSARREYNKALLAFFRSFNTIAEEELFPALTTSSLKQDAFSDFQSIYQRILNRAQAALLNLIPHIETFSTQVGVFTDTQVSLLLQSATGVAPDLMPSQVLPQVNAWKEQHNAFIRSLPEDLVQQVQATIAKGLDQGSSPTTLRKDLQERFGINRRRASLIARTEAGQLHAQLSKTRLTSLGVEEYIWRTAQDERVRSSHEHLDGTVQRYDSPPDEGNPGESFQCRCEDIPLLDSLIEELN